MLATIAHLPHWYFATLQAVGKWDGNKDSCTEKIDIVGMIMCHKRNHMLLRWCVGTGVMLGTGTCVYIREDYTDCSSIFCPARIQELYWLQKQLSVGAPELETGFTENAGCGKSSQPTRGLRAPALPWTVFTYDSFHGSLTQCQHSTVVAAIKYHCGSLLGHTWSNISREQNKHKESSVLKATTL